jgi:hypothetical protein
LVCNACPFRLFARGAVGRWKNYEPELAGMFSALQALDLVLD